jgi:hypothetical protein
VRYILFSSVLVLFLAQPARAQSRLFVSGDVFADQHRLSGDAASTRDATKVGWGGGAGVLVTERWDLRSEVEVGGTTTITRPLLASVTAFQARTRTRIAATSVLVGFHTVFGARAQMTVVGGLSFLNVKSSVDSIPPRVVIEPGTRIDNVAAPTVGIEIPIMLFRHVSVVPGLRAHAFSLSRDGAGGFAIRPGIGFHWSM